LTRNNQKKTQSKTFEHEIKEGEVGRGGVIYQKREWEGPERASMSRKKKCWVMKGGQMKNGKREKRVGGTDFFVGH